MSPRDVKSSRNDVRLSVPSWHWRGTRPPTRGRRNALSATGCRNWTHDQSLTKGLRPAGADSRIIPYYENFPAGQQGASVAPALSPRSMPRWASAVHRRLWAPPSKTAVNYIQRWDLTKGPAIPVAGLFWSWPRPPHHLAGVWQSYSL